MIQKLKKTISLFLASAIIITAPQIPAFAATDASARETTNAGASAVSGGGVATSGPAITVTTGPAVVAVTSGAISVAHISAKQTAKNVKCVKIKIRHTKGKTGNRISGYQIYKKTGSGKWKLFKKTKKKGTFSFKDKKVNYRTKYAYKVRAYYKDKSGKVIKGKLSKASKVSIKLEVSEAVISAVPVKTDVKITIAHKRAGKITGYEIYRKNDSGKWVKRASFKKTGKFTYTDTRTTNKHKNEYKVRVYFKDGRKTFYGRFSRTVSVSVKVSAVNKKVTDKNSALYGKTLVLYEYADGSMVSDPTKYVDQNGFKNYTVYVNKAKQYVTAYGVRDNKLYPLKAFICSPGNATPLGTHHIILKYRWHTLMGPCYGQWCSKVVSNGIYFHSIFSSRPNSNNTMSVRGYNNLGTTCSHGCIRLQAGSAKWIYDHCKVGSTVVITNKKGYEPFKKPSIGKLPSWHTWDPTDPTAQKYCKAHKCHSYAK